MVNSSLLQNTQVKYFRNVGHMSRMIYTTVSFETQFFTSLAFVNIQHSYHFIRSRVRLTVFRYHLRGRDAHDMDIFVSQICLG